MFAETCQVKLEDNGLIVAPPGNLLKASLNGLRILFSSTTYWPGATSFLLFAILIALEFVYSVISGPKYKLTFPKLVNFSIPSIGLVYLTPDVSTYIPIRVTSDICGLLVLGQAGFPYSSLARNQIGICNSVAPVATVWILLVTRIFSACFPDTSASLLKLKIGCSTPSIVTEVNGTMLGLVIVVPTPVVLGFPVVPSSIEVSVPP